jgi:hypothetical protein
MESRFVENKYKRWYDAIMLRAKCRSLDGYHEWHHIVPRSLGGSNEKTNIAHLTYREHFLAHWLLVKFTQGHDKIKMSFALHQMSFNPKGLRFVAAWQYKISRRAHAEAMRTRTFSESHRRKLSEAASRREHPKGWNHSVETRQIMSAKAHHKKTPGFRGRKHTEESKLKTSASMKKAIEGNKGWASHLAKLTSNPEHQRMASHARWKKNK